MSGGGPTRKREQQFQPGLLEPCALKGARTVLRGRGSGNIPSLPDNVGYVQALRRSRCWGAFRCSVRLQKISQKNHKKQPL